LRKEIWQK